MTNICFCRFDIIFENSLSMSMWIYSFLFNFDKI